MKSQLSATINKCISILLLMATLLFLSTGIFAQSLKVSENQRFLENDDGSPFFYLGDTAWEQGMNLDFKQVGQSLK